MGLKAIEATSKYGNPIFLVDQDNGAAEQKLALATERDRADALTRELTCARNELKAGNWQIAALNAFRALHSREPAVDSSQERMAESSSRTIEGKGRSPEQIFGEAVASTSGRVVRFGIAASGAAVDRSRSRFFPLPPGRTEAACPGKRTASAS
jgi:hypothetical protein